MPLQHLDSSLGVEVVYRDYGTSCQLFNPATHSINWPALQSTLLDEFVLAHSLGWWAKALLIRNTTLLWVYSITFELLERTFAVRGSVGHLDLDVLQCVQRLLQRPDRPRSRRHARSRDVGWGLSVKRLYCHAAALLQEPIVASGGQPSA